MGRGRSRCPSGRARCRWVRPLPPHRGRAHGLADGRDAPRQQGDDVMHGQTGGTQPERRAAGRAGTEQSARGRASQLAAGRSATAGVWAKGWPEPDRLTSGAIALPFPALGLVQQVGEPALTGPPHGLTTCEIGQRHGLLLGWGVDRARRRRGLCGARRCGMCRPTVRRHSCMLGAQMEATRGNYSYRQKQDGAQAAIPTCLQRLRWQRWQWRSAGSSLCLCTSLPRALTLPGLYPCIQLA